MTIISKFIVVSCLYPHLDCSIITPSFRHKLCLVGPSCLPTCSQGYSMNRNKSANYLGIDLQLGRSRSSVLLLLPCRNAPQQSPRRLCHSTNRYPQVLSLGYLQKEHGWLAQSWGPKSGGSEPQLTSFTKQGLPWSLGTGNWSLVLKKETCSSHSQSPINMHCGWECVLMTSMIVNSTQF